LGGIINLMKDKAKKENIFYTQKGDNGDTSLFYCDQKRISKSSIVIESLGSLDELNAFIGLIKLEEEIKDINFKKLKFNQILENIQQNLFIIQAEVGGFNISIKKTEINKIEKIIDEMALIIPPIKSFIITGGCLASAKLDYTRTLARKTERRVVAVRDEGLRQINKNSISYLNRLSSLLYTMSRFANLYFNKKENIPSYGK
jgi:cob(I)alamin adenosyltransferase